MMICKVLSSVVYLLLKHHGCADYICYPQNKLHVLNKGFENTTNNRISGIGIPEILTKIVSCQEFLNDTKSHFILSWRIKLIDYYISRGFLII